MGLDITAYSNLQHIGRHTMTGIWCDDENHIEAFAYSAFPQSFRGIQVLGEHTTGGSTFLVGGCYTTTDATETHGFNAGPYVGYGHWRAGLQDQFNPDLDPDGPFYELCWFADNEGTIGPDAARNLLADFEEHAARYAPPLKLHNDSRWCRDRYADWTTACRLAANAGLIDFH